ncbi:MAG: hypothetical protein R3B07_24000 [Polyangiaceae bacterium]
MTQESDAPVYRHDRIVGYVEMVARASRYPHPFCDLTPDWPDTYPELQ